MGNTKFISSTNNRRSDAEITDYYATPPEAVKLLLENESFYHRIWECACGGGHISSVLKEAGYRVKSTDLIDRGYPSTEIVDFLKVTREDVLREPQMDIVTNPPYTYAKEFVEHAMDISSNGTKVAMLLKLTFLEGKKRRELFNKYPPMRVYVFSSRISCGKNGVFTEGSAVAYAWFIWEKGVTRDPVIKWIN